MSADKARHELVSVYPRTSYGGVPRHRSQWTLHIDASDVYHKRSSAMRGGQSSRVPPLVFLNAQQWLGEKDGPYLGVASIEALEPDVCDDLPHNMEERMEEYPLIPMKNSAVDSGAGMFECGARTNLRRACLWRSAASKPIHQAHTVNTRDMRVHSGKVHGSTREQGLY